MIKELKYQFMQTAFVSIVWLTLILSITQWSSSIPFHYVWHIIGIGTLAGIVLGSCILYYGTTLPLQHPPTFSSPLSSI